MKSSSANRGMGFEGLIDYTNQLYDNKGIAVINKRPTPIRVVSNVRGRITGFFEKPSTVDYDGTYRGRSIVFEAKSTKSFDRFDLKNIEDHQYEYLTKCYKQGAITFVLIECSSLNTVFLLPYEALNYYWQRRVPGKRGTQSIPIEALEIQAYAVRSGISPVDYLAVVNKVWNLA